MNERIKVLMGFAGLQPYYDSQEEQMVKFAELIIRDSVDHAFNSGDNIAYLYKHFGVEE